MHTYNRLNGDGPQPQERGQVMVLFALLIVVFTLFVMAVVDVGFFLHERALAQQTADAAALAGSQELPGNPSSAQTIALDYVEANGLDSSDVDISFRCTAENPNVCDEGLGIYDTIVVTPHSQAPSFFGGILKLIGAGDLCWVDGCSVEATAAGCRGACGPIGYGPVDAMVVLDHSLSMSSTDLTEAKEAILTMFQNFTNEYQQVGVAMTPPVNPSNYCDAINSWSDPQDWMPAPLTTTFQDYVHHLDYSSPPVDSVDCVERGGPPGYHTNLGDPIDAAAAELIANGRPDVTWGIIIVTDGAANVAPEETITDSTGQLDCTSQAAVTVNSGDNDGYESNPSQACGDGGGYATDNNSGTSTTTSCTSGNKDRHDFWGFGADSGIPIDATVSGIEVRADAWSSGYYTRRLCVELSWDGGTTWTTYDTSNLGGYESSEYFGGTSNTWGHSWSLSELSDANFRVRITSIGADTSYDFNLDRVTVEVTYSYPNPSGVSHDGPCDYAMQQADAAKAAGIEIYVIAWGATDTCSFDDSSSAWKDASATYFLQNVATDSAHFFNEPKTSDLTPIFQVIGAQLTSGSRLVE